MGDHQPDREGWLIPVPMPTEEDIAYESQDQRFFVLRADVGLYEVCENVTTHAVVRGTFHFRADPQRALRRAIEHCDALAKGG